MESERVIEIVGRSRIVAIIRGDYSDSAVDIASALTESGVHALEVTMNSPGALATIERLAARFGSRFAIGAGTVLREVEVGQVAGAGASFIVSPNRDVGLIERTKLVGMASFPGCFTPSEIVEALAAGADAIKLFPARMLPPELIPDLQAPLDDVRFIPTGSVDPARATAYIRAGAWAVGIGTGLVNPDVLSPGGLDRLRDRASAFVTAVREGNAFIR